MYGIQGEPNSIGTTDPLLGGVTELAGAAMLGAPLKRIRTKGKRLFLTLNRY